MAAFNEEAILRERAPNWRRLLELSTKAGSTFKRLSDEEMEEFVRLYRQSSADLAYLRTHSSNESVVEYLNTVVGRAYSHLYREPHRSWPNRISDALFATAETVRRCKGAVLLSIAVFFAGAFTSSGLLTYSEDFHPFYISDDPMERANTEAWKSGEFSPRTGGESVFMTAFYASNNPRVSIITAAVGPVTLGATTTYLLWTNGVMMGTLGYEMAGVGLLDYLVTSIAPHGVTEMGGIFMAGAAGFVMAGALIRPGRRSRWDALRHAGKDAFVLVVLSVVMTLLAAPIEGFFSFDPRIPQPLKLAVGSLTFAGWLVFFIGYRRDASVEGSEELAR